MNFLLMVWGTIASVLLLLTLIYRNEIRNQPKQVWQRSLFKLNSLKKLESFFKYALIFIVVEMLFITIFICFPVILQIVLNCCKGIVLASFVPLLITGTTEERNKINSIWNILLWILAMAITYISYAVEDVKIIYIERDILILIVFLATFLTVFVLTIIKLSTGKKVVAFNKISPGIRKDLFYRTPTMKINDIEGFTIRQGCELLYQQYTNVYKKVDSVCRIEYVNLYGIYKQVWYRKAAKIMKIFFGTSLILQCFLLGKNINMQDVAIIGLLAVFLLNICWLKKHDTSFLYRITLRYFFDEWGYCIFFNDKIKFVGTVQLFEKTKYHHLVHSFLDIAAFCRAIALNDKLNCSSKIASISDNMLELSNSHAGINEKWTSLIPLWIAALFDFSVHGELHENICEKLNKCIVEKDSRRDVNIFLFSFWTDMTRQMPNKEIEVFINKFMQSIADD